MFVWDYRPTINIKIHARKWLDVKKIQEIENLKMRYFIENIINIKTKFFASSIILSMELLRDLKSNKKLVHK